MGIGIGDSNGWKVMASAMVVGSSLDCIESKGCHVNKLAMAICKSSFFLASFSALKHAGCDQSSPAARGTVVAAAGAEEAAWQHESNTHGAHPKTQSRTVSHERASWVGTSGSVRMGPWGDVEHPHLLVGTLEGAT